MMTTQPELFDATIKVTGISEEKSWTASDGQKRPFWEVSATFGDSPDEKILSLWNPRIKQALQFNTPIPIRYSQRGNKYKLEQIIGLGQERKKGSWKEPRDYSLEHLGRLQNTILVAKEGVWDSEAEKNFREAWQAYLKVASQLKT